MRAVGEFPWVMDELFCILIVVEVTQMYACVNVRRNGHERQKVDLTV